MTDLDALDVGNRVQRSGYATKGHAEIARAQGFFGNTREQWHGDGHDCQDSGITRTKFHKETSKSVTGAHHTPERANGFSTATDFASFLGRSASVSFGSATKPATTLVSFVLPVSDTMSGPLCSNYQVAWSR